MKRLVLILAFLGLASTAKAAINYSYMDYPGKKQTVTNATISVSSTTAALITPVSEFAEVRVSSASVRMFYRIDGTTTGVTTAGFPILAGTNDNVIQVYKGFPLCLQLEFGAAQTLRYQIVEPH
jgi:hypothetical protein